MLQGHIKKCSEDTELLNLETPIKQMFDKIVAKDLAGSEGIGTDNMTCIVIKFKDSIPEPTNKPLTSADKTNDNT
jgi:serine/threonine protein phosphatase PrpC